MKIQVGDLVKYKSHLALVDVVQQLQRRRALRRRANHKFKWSWQQCIDNLIGLVTKIENSKVFIHWFCLDETIWEYENYLKKV